LGTYRKTLLSWDLAAGLQRMFRIKEGIDD